MLIEPTMVRLRAMRMSAMGEAWALQQADPEVIALSFDERFAMLIEREYEARQNKKLTSALRAAKLKFPNACVEDIDAGPGRGLERAVLRQLAQGRWAKEHQAIVITGKTGTGKTYLGCAYAQLACRLGMRALYRRTSRLIDELNLARADGSYPRLIDRLAKIHVLFLDDWAMKSLSSQSRHDLLEIIDDRVGRGSTILAGQVPPDHWHDHVGDPTVADAICDRLLHTAHRITLTGPSRRDPKASRAPTVGAPAEEGPSLRDDPSSASTPTVVP